MKIISIHEGPGKHDESLGLLAIYILKKRQLSDYFASKNPGFKLIWVSPQKTQHV